MIKGIIFDMDGVIIDSEPIHQELDKILFEKLGISIHESELEKYIGVTNEYMWQDLIKRYNLSQPLEELLKTALELKMDNIKTVDIKPIEGIKPLLQKAKDINLKLAVASSSPEKYIHAVLDKFQIKEAFDYIVSGEHVKNSKPEPEIFLRAASLLNIKPEECLVIEDSTNGVKAAKAAGMICIGYENINSKNQDINLADIKVKSINWIIKNIEIIINKQ